MILCDFCDHYACFKTWDKYWNDDFYMCKCCYSGGVCGAREIKTQIIVRV